MSQNKASNSTNRKRKAQDLMILPSKQLHFRGPYRRQNWPFRNTLIDYITKTPSNAKAWKKLIQSCKYFFAKNPIIVVDRLDFRPECVVSTNSSAGRLEKHILSNNVSYKFWIAETVFMTSNLKDVSLNVQQIYRSDVTELRLYRQILLFNEFLFFSRNVKFLYLNYSCVENGNGTIVPLEKLVKNLVNLKQIEGSNYPFRLCITSNTVKELLEIPHFFQIQKCTLMNIPEVFDIETFFIYLKKNKYTKFYLCFANSISQAFKIRIGKIVDEILQTETHDYKPPWISFDGLDEEKDRKMYYLYERSSEL